MVQREPGPSLPSPHSGSAFGGDYSREDAEGPAVGVSRRIPITSRQGDTVPVGPTTIPGQTPAPIYCPAVLYTSSRRDEMVFLQKLRRNH